MKLTVQSDYALRMLIYLGIHRERVVPVSEISQAYGVSQNHLSKIAHGLVRLGYAVTKRGKSGGYQLAKPAADIRLGAVLRDWETDFNLLECFDSETDRCVLTPGCRLKKVLEDARRAFFAVVDDCTLEDLLHNRDQLRAFFV